MTEEDRNYLDNLPSLSFCENGLAFSHAGPALSFEKINELYKLSKTCSYELLESRPRGNRNLEVRGYEDSNVVNFLRKLKLNGCFSPDLVGDGLLIVGHSDKKRILEKIKESEEYEGQVFKWKNLAIFNPRHGRREKVRTYFAGNTKDLVNDSSYILDGVTNLPVYREE